MCGFELYYNVTGHITETGGSISIDIDCASYVNSINPEVTGILGKNMTLKWNITIPEGYAVNNLKVYLIKAVKQNIIAY